MVVLCNLGCSLIPELRCLGDLSNLGSSVLLQVQTRFARAYYTCISCQSSIKKRSLHQKSMPMGMAALNQCFSLAFFLAWKNVLLQPQKPWLSSQNQTFIDIYESMDEIRCPEISRRMHFPEIDPIHTVVLISMMSTHCTIAA